MGGGENSKLAKQCSTALQQAWKLSNDQRAAIAWIAGYWRILHSAHSHPWPVIQRLLIQPAAADAVDAAKAIAGDSEGLGFCSDRLSWPTERLNPPPFLDGQALIAMGVQPGPDFKRVLAAVRDAQLNGEIDCSEAAARLATKLLNE